MNHTDEGSRDAFLTRRFSRPIGTRHVNAWFEKKRLVSQIRTKAVFIIRRICRKPLNP